MWVLYVMWLDVWNAFLWWQEMRIQINFKKFFSIVTSFYLAYYFCPFARLCAGDDKLTKTEQANMYIWCDLVFNTVSPLLASRLRRANWNVTSSATLTTQKETFICSETAAASIPNNPKNNWQPDNFDWGSCTTLHLPLYKYFIVFLLLINFPRVTFTEKATQRNKAE